MNRAEANDKQQIYDVLIIGGGITGLSIGAKLFPSDLSFAIVDKAPRMGGQIKTLSQKGYTFETGPNTGSISWPDVKELFEFLDNDDLLEIADSSAKARWIWKGNKFHNVPSGPLDGAATPLFSIKDKIGILREPFKKKGNNPDETVGELAERRLGKSMVDYAVAPFISGVYAGDPYKLVTRYAFPKLYHLEQNYGSFIRGSIGKMKEKKSERDKKASKEVFSSKGGFGVLVKALCSKIAQKGDLFCGIETEKIERNEKENYWLLSGKDRNGNKQTIYSRRVVSTIPSYAIPEILPQLSDEEKSAMTNLEYAPMIELSVGYDHLPSEVKHNAFGGLVPPKENRKVLGILFPSATFKNRVPYKDSALFTIFMGGMSAGPRLLKCSDEEIIEQGVSELETMLHIPAGLKPSLIYISKHPKAIPQYTHHMNILYPILEQLENKMPGFIFAGGLRGGIGLANRIKQGSDIGQQLIESLTSKIRLNNEKE